MQSASKEHADISVCKEKQICLKERERVKKNISFLDALTQHVLLLKTP